MINLGVAGCGRISTLRHLPALMKTTGISVVALADVDERRLNDVATQFAVQKRYKDFSEMIADPGLDAVAVCLPPEFHFDAAKLAIENNKHLYLEKPVALNLQESSRLLVLEEDSNKLIMVGFNLRWHRLVKEAKAILRSGKIGKIRVVSTVFTSGSMLDPELPPWRRHRSSGGGALCDQAIHHFDLCRYLLEDEFRAMKSVTSATDDSVVLSGELMSGILVNSTVSQASAPNNELEFFGEKGRLRISLYRADGIQFFPAGSYPGDVKQRVGEILGNLSLLRRILFREESDYVRSYEHAWNHFVHSIQTRTKPECTLLDGHRSLEVLSMALKSCEVFEKA